MNKTVLITAVEHDGFNERTLSIRMIISDTDKITDIKSLKKAVYNACTDYANTKEGKNIYIGNCHNFNWGDFDAYVPNSICAKYGFTKVTDSDDIVDTVNFDEDLINEDELKYLYEDEE